jgi:hypothetical protein
MELLISPMLVLVLLAVLVTMGFHVLREGGYEDISGEICSAQSRCYCLSYGVR